MSIRPLEDRILVKPTAAETQTASGIFLPESAKEKPILVRGVLVATPHRVEQHAASRRTVLMMVMVMVRILVAASH